MQKRVQTSFQISKDLNIQELTVTSVTQLERSGRKTVKTADPAESTTDEIVDRLLWICLAVFGFVFIPPTVLVLVYKWRSSSNFISFLQAFKII